MSHLLSDLLPKFFPKNLGFMAVIFLTASRLNAQGNCECTNCPQFMPDLFVGGFEITVQGATNPMLGQNGQGVCGVVVHWDHTAICDISITLTSPSGQTVTLVGPIGQFCTSNGNAGTDWNVTFLPCGNPNVMPDPGFTATWNNNQPWGGGNQYSGSYYPFAGCLQNFSGPVNGVWTLTVTDGQANDVGNLYDYEIIFCDPSGINCFNCEAEAGALAQADISDCEMSPSLALDLPPSYPPPSAAPPAGYSYAYIITGPGGVIQAIEPSPDLTGYPPGNYTVCGLSYLSTDANKLPVPNGVLTITTLANQLTSNAPPFCGDLSSDCVNVTIKSLPPDEEEYAAICAPQCYEFHDLFFCNSGDFPVQVLGPNGCPFTATLHLTVNQPDVSLVNETICAGSCSQNPLFPTACSAGSYQATTQNIYGCDSTVTLVLNVILVDAQIQPPPVLGCGQSSATLSGAGSTTGSGVSYLWTATSGGTIIGPTNLINATIGSAGHYTLRVCRTQGGKTCCDSTSVNVLSNNQLPPMPVFNQGDSTLCQGQNVSFTINAVPGVSGYVWTVPGGVTINSGQNTTSLNVSWTSATGGNVCVSTQNACGLSTPACYPVTIEAIPQASIPVGDTTVCAGASETYGIAPVAGALSYNWTAGNGGAVLSGQGSTQVQVQWPGSGTSSVCVSATGACGTSAPACLAVEVGAVPPATGISGDSALCTGSTVNYSATPVAGAGTYVWTLPAGATLITGQNTTGIAVGWNAAPGGNVCVAAGNGCGLGPVSCLQVGVKEQPTADAGAGGILCGNQFVVNAAPSVAGSSGQWLQLSGPGTLSFGQANADSTLVSAGNSGTYDIQWTETNGTCTSADTISVTFNASPVIGTVGTVCAPDNQTYTVQFTISAGAAPYNIPGGTVSGNNFTSDPIPSGQAYSFQITDANGCVSPMLSGSFNCNCTSAAGNMSSQLLSACMGDSIQAQHLGGQQYDSNDAGAFVLHTISGGALGTVLAQNNSGMFGFMPGMNYGATYYVSFVVGDSLNGFPNPADSCLSVAPGQPVVFYQNPVAGTPLETCDGANLNFQITIGVSGGQTPYSANGSVFAGASFLSPFLPNGTAYNYTFTDANGCASPPVSGTFSCACSTAAGLMGQQLLIACEDATVSAQALGGALLDANDVSAYVLHSSQVDSLGTIWAENTSGVFGLQPGMSIDSIYYISLVVGNNDNGLPDLNDPCLAVAPGQPLVFRKKPTPHAGQDVTVCGTTLSLEATDFGINGQWDVVAGPGAVFLGSSDSVYTVVSVQIFGDYLLTWTEDSGICAASDTVQATFWSVPSLSGITEICNPVNTAYTVQFQVQDGTAPFVVTGLTGNFAGNTFSSTPLADNSAYNFILSDLHGCQAAAVSGQHDCLCATNAGSMAPAPLVFCTDTPASAVWNNDAALDADDMVQFILHDQPGPSLGTVLAVANNPGFAFGGNLQTGITYYISAIAGNVQNGNVQLSDPCLSIAPGTPVRWKPMPGAAITGDAVVCAGDATPLSLSGSGEYPLQLLYSAGAGNIQLNIPGPQAVLLSVSPGTTTTYQLISVSDGTLPTCTTLLSESVTVQVSQPLSAGIAAAAQELCEGLAQQISLPGLLTGADPVGIWTDVSTTAAPPGAFFPNSGNFLTAGVPAGDYRFRYAVDAQAPCPDGSTEVEVIVHPAAMADAGADQTLDCNQTVAQLGTAGAAVANYQWTLGGSTVANTDTFSTTIPGDYTLLVTTNFGCTDSDVAVVILDPGLPSAQDLRKTDIDCFGNGNGSIEVAGIHATHPPVLVALNNGPFGVDTLFGALAPGVYTIRLQDAIGCEWLSDTLEILEPAPLGVDLGPDLTINLGETVDLTAQIFNQNGMIDTIIWSPLPDSARVGTNRQEFLPMRSLELRILVRDANGCSAEDRILISVLRARHVYVPNAIKPGNTLNNYITVYGGPDVAEVESFQIFGRWGEHLYEAFHFQPNDPLVRWEGNYKGKALSPGVYAYYLVVRFIDGQTEVFTGDITVLR